MWLVWLIIKNTIQYGGTKSSSDVQTAHYECICMTEIGRDPSKKKDQQHQQKLNQITISFCPKPILSKLSKSLFVKCEWWKCRRIGWKTNLGRVTSSDAARFIVSTAMGAGEIGRSRSAPKSIFCSSGRFLLALPKRARRAHDRSKLPNCQPVSSGKNGLLSRIASCGLFLRFTYDRVHHFHFRMNAGNPLDCFHLHHIVPDFVAVLDYQLAWYLVKIRRLAWSHRRHCCWTSQCDVWPSLDLRAYQIVTDREEC